MTDYTNIENWTKAKLEEELEKLEPAVSKMRKQLNRMQDSNHLTIGNITASTWFNTSTNTTDTALSFAT